MYLFLRFLLTYDFARNGKRTLCVGRCVAENVHVCVRQGTLNFVGDQATVNARCGICMYVCVAALECTYVHTFLRTEKFKPLYN